MNENKKNEVIFIGLPNSGKSTLINALTKKKSSIVGSQPNTTRDKVSTSLEVKNKQIILSDLPGFDEEPDDFNKAFQKKLQQILGQLMSGASHHNKTLTLETLLLEWQALTEAKAGVIA